MSDDGRPLPDAFLLGTGTSAWQVEGAWDADGKGPSTWDRFAHAGGSSEPHAADVACDSYRRLDEDLDLAAGLGLDLYRFSVSWPRVLPDGRVHGGGARPRAASRGVNAEGLGYYDRLVDGLLARGVQPCLTAFHWDTPAALGDDADGRDAWTHRSTAHRFADYVAVLADRLADRVAWWATLNEPWVVTDLGHRGGGHAPGVDDPVAAARVHHHLLLGHGLAVQALRAAGVRGTAGAAGAGDGGVGVVQAEERVDPAGPDAVAAAELHRDHRTRAFDQPLLGDGYPATVEAAYAREGARLPVEDGDLEVLRQPLDWYGVNYYTRSVVDVDGGTLPPEPPLTDMGWEVWPRGLRDLLVQLDAEHGREGTGTLPPVLVTENGVALPDRPGDDGRVDDPGRVDFHRDHLAAVLDAADAGVDVRGYVAWSLLDNVEWDSGRSRRFGLVHVDPATQDRTRKASGDWYAELCRERVLR